MTSSPSLKFQSGASNIPPDRSSGRQVCGIAQWVCFDGSWFSWCGSASELRSFRELAESGLFSSDELITHADWKLDRWVGDSPD